MDIADIDPVQMKYKTLLAKTHIERNIPIHSWKSIAGLKGGVVPIKEAQRYHNYIDWACKTTS